MRKVARVTLKGRRGTNVKLNKRIAAIHRLMVVLGWMSGLASIPLTNCTSILTTKL